MWSGIHGRGMGDAVDALTTAGKRHLTPFEAFFWITTGCRPRIRERSNRWRICWTYGRRMPFPPPRDICSYPSSPRFASRKLFLESLLIHVLWPRFCTLRTRSTSQHIAAQNVVEIFKRAGVWEQSTFSIEGRDTSKRNAIASEKNVFLLWLGHPYLFSIRAHAFWLLSCAAL